MQAAGVAATDEIREEVVVSGTAVVEQQGHFQKDRQL